MFSHFLPEKREGWKILVKNAQTLLMEQICFKERKGSKARVLIIHHMIKQEKMICIQTTTNGNSLDRCFWKLRKKRPEEKCMIIINILQYLLLQFIIKLNILRSLYQLSRTRRLCEGCPGAEHGKEILIYLSTRATDLVIKN